MDINHPAHILAANIARYRHLIEHEADPKQIARLRQALARDLKTQELLPANERAGL